MKVEKPAEFRGGVQVWLAYLQRHMKADNPVQATVVVQFVIEKDGSVSNVKAVSGPMELREGAEDVIKGSPRWIPAVNKGVKVRSLLRQPMVYVHMLG